MRAYLTEITKTWREQLSSLSFQRLLTILDLPLPPAARQFRLDKWQPNRGTEQRAPTRKAPVQVAPKRTTQK